MSSRWFRMYDDILHDPKVQMLPGNLFKAWVNFLALASKHGGRFPPLSTMAYELRLSEGGVTKLLQSLKAIGLVDQGEEGMKPHNWDGRQHIRDLSTERVKRFRKRTLERDETVSSAVSETLVPSVSASASVSESVSKEVMSIFNSTAAACGWSSVQQIRQNRKKLLAARLAECGGIDGWKAAMAKASESDFLTGRSSRSEGHENWRPNFDWFLKASNFTKLMEGSYDNRPIVEHRNGAGKLKPGTSSSVHAGMADLADELNLRDAGRREPEIFPPGTPHDRR